MKLLIGADFVPTESNEDLFVAGDIETLVGEELFSELTSADYRIFNLETPITDKATPINKCGPNLRAPLNTVHGYNAAGVNLVTIANNHILDQGFSGLTDTCRILADNGIDYFGAGKNIAEASRPYIIEIGQRKIGLYACVEHEFSVATEITGGANPFDPLESFDHISKLSKECSFTIVLYHGGVENYRYPSPNLQKICRKFINKGANLVICQHSHCIGCAEMYDEGTIVYGQGNFLFDYSKNEVWKTGLIIKIDDELNISYIPIVKNDNGIRMADSKETRSILGDFNFRSEEIKNEHFIKDMYRRHCKNALPIEMANMGIINVSIVGRILNRVSKGIYFRSKAQKIIHNRKFLSMLNSIECETHREILISGLREYLD